MSLSGGHHEHHHCPHHKPHRGQALRERLRTGWLFWLLPIVGLASLRIGSGPPNPIRSATPTTLKR